MQKSQYKLQFSCRINGQAVQFIIPRPMESGLETDEIAVGDGTGTQRVMSIIQ